MSMLVVVTFDLHGAKPKEYPRVKAALAQRRLKKEIRSGKSGKLSKLPANTFAAKFSGKWNKRAANELRDYVRNEVRQVIRMLRLTATVFVAVGDRWAWGRRYVT